MIPFSSPMHSILPFSLSVMFDIVICSTDGIAEVVGINVSTEEKLLRTNWSLLFLQVRGARRLLSLEIMSFQDKQFHFFVFTINIHTHFPIHIIQDRWSVLFTFKNFACITIAHQHTVRLCVFFSGVTLH